jgi:hypothetical protein
MMNKDSIDALRLHWQSLIAGDCVSCCRAGIRHKEKSMAYRTLIKQRIGADSYLQEVVAENAGDYRLQYLFLTFHQSLTYRRGKPRFHIAIHGNWLREFTATIKAIGKWFKQAHGEF